VARAAFLALLAIVSAGLVAGCGSICNYASGDPEVYGGPQFDIQCALTPTNNATDGKGAAILAGLLCADVGLSFVFDTLTLPLTLYLRHREYNAGEQPPGTMSVADQASKAQERPATFTTADVPDVDCTTKIISSYFGTESQDKKADGPRPAAARPMVDLFGTAAP
jgi:uncharacterized protein YceK